MPPLPLAGDAGAAAAAAADVVVETCRVVYPLVNLVHKPHPGPPNEDSGLGGGSPPCLHPTRLPGVLAQPPFRRRVERCNIFCFIQSSLTRPPDECLGLALLVLFVSLASCCLLLARKEKTRPSVCRFFSACPEMNDVAQALQTPRPMPAHVTVIFMPILLLFFAFQGMRSAACVGAEAPPRKAHRLPRSQARQRVHRRER